MIDEANALSVTVTQHGSTHAVVRVGGELDIATGLLLHHQLAAQVTSGRTHLVIDLSGVPFMDSSGLNTILRTDRETRAAGGGLVLAGAGPQVRRLLELTGVDLTIPLVDDAHAALADAGTARSEPGAPAPGR